MSTTALNSIDDLPSYTDADAETLLGEFPPAPPEVARLDLPLALPQIAGSYDSSFLRAYSPDLERSGVSQDEWLRFIDGLNIAIVSTLSASLLGHATEIIPYCLLQTASPPLRVADLTGRVLGMM